MNNNNAKLQYNYNLNSRSRFQSPCPSLSHFHDFRLITNKSHNPKHNIFTIKIQINFSKAEKSEIKAITKQQQKQQQ